MTGGNGIATLAKGISLALAAFLVALVWFVPPPAADASGSCPLVKVIGAKGSGKNGKPIKAFTSSLRDQLGSKFFRSDIEFKWLDYPAVKANYRNLKKAPWSKGSYRHSVDRGVDALRKALRNDRCLNDSRYVVAGYSQGAQVIGDVYESGLVKKSRPRILATVLFGDPMYTPWMRRVKFRGGAAKTKKTGILAWLILPRLKRDAFEGYGVLSYCRSADPICQRNATKVAQGQLSDHEQYHKAEARSAARAVAGRIKRRVSPPQLPPVKAVSAGAMRTCVIRLDDTVACWGYPGLLRTRPPAGKFTQISTGHEHNCGIRLDGTVECWGLTWSQGRPLDPPDGTFDSLAAGGRHACGIRPGGLVTCWGNDDYGQATPPPGIFSTLSVGEDHTCGIRVDGAVVCWGDDSYGQSEPATGQFVEVSAGWFHTCGLRVGGQVACWGSNEFGQSIPAEGEFRSVAAGGEHTCAVKIDFHVVCWGNDYVDDSGNHHRPGPPDVEMVTITSSFSHSCGLRPDGRIECWYDNYYCNGSVNFARCYDRRPFSSTGRFEFGQM